MTDRDPNWNAARVASETAAWAVMDAGPRVRCALETFGARTALATSFSPEDIALTELAVETRLPFRLLALDTGRLPEETHWVAEQVRARYGLSIEWWLPDAGELQGLLATQGGYAFRQSLEARQACCDVRKIRSLRRALADTPAWLTGLRRAHGVTRTTIEAIAWDDASGGLVKVNPLFDWDDERLAAFTSARALPQNRLIQDGYLSIGCAPCTRAVRPGEPARAGRWWWEDPNHAECGLHPVHGGRR